MPFEEKTVLEALNATTRGTLMETLDIQYVEYDKNVLSAVMPVNTKVMQPYGKLHGGATAALIETVASVISLLEFENPLSVSVYGVQLNVNHLNSVSEGFVKAEAKILKAGKSLHVVEVKVRSDKGDLISVGTQTNSVKPNTKDE